MMFQKNGWKYVVFAFFVVLPFRGFSGSRVVFSENFDSPDALKKWHVVEYPGSGTFRVENGTLSVIHNHNPGKGSYIEIPIPAVSCGQVDFDVLIDPDHVDPTVRIGLTFEIYNIASFWHDSLRDWRMYFPEPNASRMPNFDLEPVGHHRISMVPKYKFVHYRIVFDEKRDLVEFYSGDMLDPKASRFDVSVFGHGFYRGGYLRIGSFGITSDSYRTIVDNVVIREFSGNSEVRKKDQILIFDGICSDLFKVYPLLKKKNPWNAEGARRYTWNSPGPNLLPDRNNFRYDGMPGFQTVENAALIIFNDAPNVDEPLQKQIVRSVSDGADLLILSGVFSLGKGGFRNSSLEKILPVILPDDIWTLAGDGKTDYSLHSKNGFGWNAEGKVLFHFWDLKPSEGAEVLVTVSKPDERRDIPILLRKRFGKGNVYVLTGTACGQSRENSFWEGDFLMNLLRTIHESKEK